MGSSGSYSGSGGKIGGQLRDDVGAWLDGLPSEPPQDQPADGQTTAPHIDPNTLLPAIALIRPVARRGSGADGPSGGGGGSIGSGGARTGRTGGGPQRTSTRSASTAGRAAAAAYAYRTGDVATLERLGLDYAELRGLSDPIEVTRRIVDAACGPIGLSTIEDHEQRMVAAEIAEWVIGESQDGSLPAPDEIARKTIALIITEVVASETGEMLRQGKQPGWANEIAEHELREAAEALAARADLSVDGVTENEFASAIENGIETLRRILGGST